MATCKISSFESMATLDGDGVRYAVFLTGCPLRCCYCHNPDTWHGCAYEMTPVQLAEKVHRYKTYFGVTGGVTFSGGEPLLQAEFINQTAIHLKLDGIGYALDTSGNVELTKDVVEAVKNSDLVILDLKFYNENDYRKYANGSFEKFSTFAKMVKENGKRLWLRTVIVPNLNDKLLDLERYAEIAKRYAPERYELLGFHTMGFSKYEKLGIENPLQGYKDFDSDELKNLQRELDRLMAEN